MGFNSGFKGLISLGVRGEHSLIHTGSLGTMNLCERGQLRGKEGAVVIFYLAKVTTTLFSVYKT